MAQVILFLSTVGLGANIERSASKGVKCIGLPKTMDYGQVTGFDDPYGNLWDLIEFSIGHPKAVSVWSRSNCFGNILN